MNAIRLVAARLPTSFGAHSVNFIMAMRTKFTFKLLLTCTLAFCWAGSMFAQAPRQVIIANGGVFSTTNMVRIAAWNQSNGNYFLFDSLAASSVQDVIVDGNIAYVAADSFVVKYDIDSYTRLALLDLSGVRQLAIFDDKLIVTRGFGASSDFVKILNTSDLSEVASVSAVPAQCEGVVVVGDSAYVTMPGSFGATTGSIVSIDLGTNDVALTIPLDTLGAGVGRIYHSNEHLYTLNAIAWGSSYGVVSDYDLSTGIVSNNIVQSSVSGGAGIENGNLYGNFGGNFSSFDLANQTVTSIISGSPAAAKIDTAQNRFFLTQSDYLTFGAIERYDWSGTRLDSMAIGISPEAFDFDYRQTVSAASAFNEEVFIQTFPNPVVNEVTVDMSRIKLPVQSILVSDMQGRTLMQATTKSRMETLDLSQFPAGTYLIRVRTAKGDYAKIILK